MAGLLDGFSEFVKTPEGQGLLAATFGGLAGARSGAPINSLGRAGLAGLQGYGGALDRQQQMAEAEQTKKLRDMQMQQSQMQMEAAKRKAAQDQAQLDWRTGLPAVMEQKVYGAGDEGPTMAPDSNALKSYLMQPNSPFAEDLLKNQLFPKAADYKVVGDNLLQVGADGVKPVFTAPAKPEAAPAAVKEYQFAVGQGYKGSFQQFQLEQKRAGATNVSNSVSMAGPKAFETELGKMDAEQLVKWRDGAQAAQTTLGTVKRLEDAEKQGAYSGGAANLKMTVGSYINGITGATPKGQVGSEIYNAEANKLVLDQIKSLGANPSNADLAFIQKIVPQLSTNLEARRQLTTFMKEKANSAIDLYGRANTHARKNSGLGGFEVVPRTGDSIDDLVNKYNR